MGFFRVEVVIPKDLSHVKSKICKAMNDEDSKFHEEFKAFEEDERIERYRLRSFLLKVLPHMEKDVQFLVASLTYGVDNCISKKEFLEKVRIPDNPTSDEDVSNRRKVISTLAKFQCGTEDYLPFIESESVNAYIFTWNTTSDGAENARKVLAEEGIGSFGIGSQEPSKAKLPTCSDESEKKGQDDDGFDLEKGCDPKGESKEHEQKLRPPMKVQQARGGGDERGEERKNTEDDDDELKERDSDENEAEDSENLEPKGEKEEKDGRQPVEVEKNKQLGIVSIFALSAVSPEPEDHLENKRKEMRKQKECSSDHGAGDKQGDQTEKTGFISSYMVKFQEYAEAGRRPLFEIHAEVESGMHMTFNYMCKLYGGAAIAAVGLGVNSASIVVASMLISPLMGPLLAIVFGLAVHDWNMVRVGFLNETKSMFHCIFMGFIMGLVLTPVIASDQNWPTIEMEARGTILNFYAGLFFGLASGVVVGVSVSDNGFNQLVGVAISASLLPPVVNTGMGFSVLCIGAPIYGKGDFRSTDRNGGTATDFHIVSNNRGYVAVGTELEYKVDVNLFETITIVSLVLYIANCVIIIVVCLLVFKLKHYTVTKAVDLGWHSHDSMWHRWEELRGKFRRTKGTHMRSRRNLMEGTMMEAVEAIEEKEAGRGSVPEMSRIITERAVNPRDSAAPFASRFSSNGNLGTIEERGSMRRH